MPVLPPPRADTHDNSCLLLFMQYYLTPYLIAPLGFSQYSSGNIKTDSIRSVSACLAVFETIWHFLTSGLAFLVHLHLANLVVYCPVVALSVFYSTVLMRSLVFLYL